MRNVMHETHHSRVSLPNEDVEGVDKKRLTVHAINFDDGHVVAIDGECVVWIAGNIDNTEAIAEDMISGRCSNTLRDPAYRFPAVTVITARSEAGPRL